MQRTKVSLLANTHLDFLCKKIIAVMHVQNARFDLELSPMALGKIKLAQTQSLMTALIMIICKTNDNFYRYRISKLWRWMHACSFNACTLAFQPKLMNRLLQSGVNGENMSPEHVAILDSSAVEEGYEG